MDGHNQKRWSGIEAKKELLTSGSDRQGEEEGVSKYVEGDLTWCGETFLFHTQSLSMRIHSWLLLVLCI